MNDDPRLHVGEIHRSKATAGERVLQSIRLNEITFREIDVFPVAMSMDRRLDLAAQLDEVGVDQIQIRTLDAAEMVQGIRKRNLGIRVQAITRPYFPRPYPDWRAEIEAAAEAKIDSITIMQGISNRRIANEPLDGEAVLRGLAEWVGFARKAGIAEVSLGLADSARADFPYLERAIRTGVDAGADLVHLADSMGVLRPTTMKYLIESVQQWTDVPLAVHCHNSFGLALANALAAAEVGVYEFDVAVNGQDPSKGLPALDEFALALYALYDRDLGIDLERMYELSHLYARETAVPVPPYKPVVGELAFAKQRELSIRGVLKDPNAWEPFDPEMVGNRLRVSMGVGVGPTAVRLKLDELGLSASDDELGRLVDLVNAGAEAKWRLLDDNEVRELAAVAEHG